MVNSWVKYDSIVVLWERCGEILTQLSTNEKLTNDEIELLWMNYNVAMARIIELCKGYHNTSVSTVIKTYIENDWLDKEG
jgi:hypothetical protein